MILRWMILLMMEMQALISAKKLEIFLGKFNFSLGSFEDNNNNKNQNLRPIGAKLFLKSWPLFFTNTAVGNMLRLYVMAFIQNG